MSCAAENLLPATRIRQLLVDVSELVQRDAGTGIQRVTKNITLKLLENPPPGFRVEPVYDDGTGVFRYARALAAKLIDAPSELGRFASAELRAAGRTYQIAVDGAT